MSYCRSPWWVVALLAISAAAGARELRVCADPNNLPFSDRSRAGLENRIVELVAEELGSEVRYVWWAQRRGSVRETLNARRCDLIPGIGTGVGSLATTSPYYRSTYVFVTRTDRGLDVETFDDPRLRQLTIGVQLIGDDSSNTPPAHELARRGIVANVRGYMVYGDYLQKSPARAIVEDVAKGVLDIAVVWGPVGGYFSKPYGGTLEVRAVNAGGAQLPMVFDISMGVRKSDPVLRDAIEAALSTRTGDISSILAEFGVPVLQPERKLTKPIQ
jgi:mxaJ protein